MTRWARQSEKGFTLVEMLVTVVIVGVAFVTFVDGMYAAIVTSDYHRKQATVQAAMRNTAEALKATTYVSCATTSNYPEALWPTRTAGQATASGTSETAPSLNPGQANSQLLLFYALGTGSSFSPAPNTAERWDLASGGPVPANRITASLDDQAWASSAATGTRTATSAAAGSAVAQAVLLESSSTIARRNVATASSAGSTTLAVNRPTGTQFGDALVAQIVVPGGTSTSITPPTGWSLVETLDNGTSVKSAIYQRTSSGTSTSYTWTFNPSVESAGGIVSYSGVNDFVASIGGIKHWNGTDFSTDSCNPPVTTPPTPATDNGLQLITLTVTATNQRETRSVDVMKRRP